MTNNLNNENGIKRYRNGLLGTLSLLIQRHGIAVLLLFAILYFFNKDVWPIVTTQAEKIPRLEQMIIQQGQMLQKLEKILEEHQKLWQEQGLKNERITVILSRIEDTLTDIQQTQKVLQQQFYQHNRNK